YMAPEQIRGENPDARTDIFAFGAVLYEMVTGRRAFLGKSQISVMSAILEKEPEPLSAVQPLTPDSLDRLLRTCLEKDPADRFDSPPDLRPQLQPIAREPSGVTPASILPGRSSRLAWSVAVGLLVTAAALSLGLWFADHAPRPVWKSQL